MRKKRARAREDAERNTGYGKNLVKVLKSVFKNAKIRSRNVYEHEIRKQEENDMCVRKKEERTCFTLE